MGIVWTILFYAGVAATLTAGVALFLRQNPLTAKLFIASFLGTLFLWVISLVKRKKATCPLCKGSPLYETRARKHKKAVRTAPFNHAQTAVLSSLLTQRFCCMFCGSPFDLQRPSKEQLQALNAKARGEKATSRKREAKPKKMKVQR